MLAEFLEKQAFQSKLEEVVLNWLSDPVYQIRDEAINVLITLKSKIFDQQWLEQISERKIDEFISHEKFGQRIQSVFFISKVYGDVSDKFLNEKLCPYLFKLAEDPVPNIKFNVAKTIEIVYKKVNNTNKMKC